MRTPVIFSVFALILISTFPVLAQRDSVRVRVFDGSGEELQRPSKVQASYDDKNFFGWNVYLLGRGAFVLGYERILHPKHGITIDAGLTYRDFIYEGYNDDLFDEAEVKVGHYVAASYKFYPKDYNDFDGGLYLSPAVANRAYSRTNTVSYYYNGTNSKTAEVDVGYNVTEYSFRMGYVRESFIDDLIADFYMGVGGRQITSNSYDVVTDNGGVQRIVATKDTKKLPALYLGFKIGFTF